MSEIEDGAKAEVCCRRCGDPTCSNPDSKACSDNCIGRYQRELAQWTKWGIVEVSVRNPSVMEYMRHWEGRTLKAEAELAKVKAELERYGNPTVYEVLSREDGFYKRHNILYNAPSERGLSVMIDATERRDYPKEPR